MDTIFEKIAAKYHTTPEEVYMEIQKAIDTGFDNPDAQIQAEWGKLRKKGERPTPEDLIAFLMGTLSKSQVER